MIPTTNLADDGCFMMQAVDLARRNRDPNRRKAIAALIVKDGMVIASGVRTTRKDQGSGLIDTCHAEDAALQVAGHGSRGSTLYTTLAPCAERANLKCDVPKRPCCQLVADAGVARVVIGAFDEDFGKGGVEYLIERGVCVEQYPLPESVVQMLLGKERGRPVEGPGNQSADKRFLDER
jgi:diaminohydroxyphosphoribosylaminopyrimidine deaminase/5-amino-6-(5-phosphoribosylamino)uracil reductase